MFNIMQGDAYNIPMIFKVEETVIIPSVVNDIEIVIGTLDKKYSKSEITYDDGVWYFPITQAESLAMDPIFLDAQVRIKFTTGIVKGTTITEFISVNSLSKEVL